MMKKRIFAAALAACLSLAPMQAFAGAARILPSVTVNMHGNSGLTCTMTDVLSYYKPTHIAFYFAENGTISFNQEVELLIGWHTRLGQHEVKRLQPGEKYTVSDAPGSKSDGLSGQVFLNTGDASFLFSAPIVYVDKGERRVENSTLRRLLTFSDEELKENNIYPLADIAVGGLPPEPAAASPTAQPLLVNGQRVSGMEAYNIGGYNYFKLRDLAQVLNGTEKQFDVDWDAERNAISLA
ncbi:MAG: hypothetical protein LBG71_00040, partial [Clostridiales Family XIII bacterium]|nr:hypothetical protein [Clostridiales Family XIII bacterium]